MTYIYAYSNHRYGLDRLKRMAVLYKDMQDKAIEIEMLTNDFRAASFIEDYGVPKCTTIESVWDIDMVAPHGAEHLVLDTPEDDAGKIEEYVKLFGKVTRVTDCMDQESVYGEGVMVADSMVDSFFIEAKQKPKSNRSVLFYGDSDHEKWLLKNLQKLSKLRCDLLLGEYFFLGYEDELKGTFGTVWESDKYMDIVSSSQKIITFSMQCALEAKASGAETIYISDNMHECQRDMLIELGVCLRDNVENIDV